jgi:hypothetical protein
MAAMTRMLRLRGRAGEAEIPIRIFWPVQEKAAWSCRWEIDWPDRQRSNSARGFDAIQALINALQMVGSEIYCSDAHNSGKLVWVEERTGYGFPVPNNIRDLLVGDDAKYL